jgi:death-on-curing protein
VNEPDWIDETTALAIHRRQLAEHGGADGVREPHLLSSALARPHNRFAYDEASDLAALAASYAHGIITNHPFVDGNKRTGYVVARLFLALNGYDVDASQDEKYVAVYGVAAGTTTEDEFAEWLRERLRLRD